MHRRGRAGIEIFALVSIYVEPLRFTRLWLGARLISVARYADRTPSVVGLLHTLCLGRSNRIARLKGSIALRVVRNLIR